MVLQSKVKPHQEHTPLPPNPFPLLMLSTNSFHTKIIIIIIKNTVWKERDVFHFTRQGQEGRLICMVHYLLDKRSKHFTQSLVPNPNKRSRVSKVPLKYLI